MNGVYCLNCISKDEKWERIAIKQPLRRIYKHETKENRAMGDKETKTILSRFSEPEVIVSARAFLLPNLFLH